MIDNIVMTLSLYNIYIYPAHKEIDTKALIFKYLIILELQDKYIIFDS